MKTATRARVVSPPSFPARPMNGGRLEQMEPLHGDWRWKPKWNGRRVLCHVPTMRTWNRQLEEVGYIHPAFKKLQLEVGLRWPECEWLDLEFLWGRHSLGKGAIIVLDYIAADADWTFRQVILNDIFSQRLRPGDVPAPNSVCWGMPICGDHRDKIEETWKHLQAFNRVKHTTFFEGLVAYNCSQPYPVQLFSPKKETRHWIKYRFVN